MRQWQFIFLSLILFLSLLNLSFCGNDSPFATRLRASMKHKYILDFLIKEKPEASIFHGDGLLERTKDSTWFGINETENDQALESFTYYINYNIYKITGSDYIQYYLLEGYEVSGLVSMFLLSNDTTDLQLLDKRDFDASEATNLEFKTINNIPFIVLSSNHGSGGSGYLTYHEEEALYDIDQSKFLLQYESSPLTISQAREDVDSTIVILPDSLLLRQITTTQFVDLNNDNSLDIKEEISQDIIFADSKNVTPIYWKQADISTHISHKTNIYYWDAIRRVFKVLK